jgi:hypothetical protein
MGWAVFFCPDQTTRLPEKKGGMAISAAARPAIYRDCHDIAQYGAWLNATFEFHKNPPEATGGDATSKTYIPSSKDKKTSLARS